MKGLEKGRNGLSSILIKVHSTWTVKHNDKSRNNYS